MAAVPWGRRGSFDDLLATQRLVVAAEAAGRGDVGGLEELVKVFAPRLINPCSHPVRDAAARAPIDERARSLRAAQSLETTAASHRELAVKETALQLADALDLHEGIALRLVEQAASEEVPDHAFFASAISGTTPPPNPRSAEWREHVFAFASLRFFFSRANVLYALHALLEACALDGVTVAAATSSGDMQRDTAATVRAIVVRWLLEANADPVTGPGLRRPKGPAGGQSIVAAAASAGGGATGGGAASDPHTAVTPVAGKGLVCALLSGIVALTRDVWHARIAFDPLRAVRGDFDRVRAARCVSQLARVFQLRLGAHLAPPPGPGSLARSKQEPWLPESPEAGELGVIASVLAWVVGVPMRASPDHTEASADHQTACALLLATFGACPDAYTALLVPRAGGPGPGSPANGALRQADLAGDGSQAGLVGLVRSLAGAPASELSPATLEVIERRVCAVETSCAVGRLLCESEGARAALGIHRRSASGHAEFQESCWRRWQGAVCLAALSSIAAWATDVRRRLGTDTEAGKAVRRVMAEARNRGGMLMLASLAAGPRFAATEVPGGWAVERLFAAVAEAAAIEMQQAAADGGGGGSMSAATSTSSHGRVFLLGPDDMHRLHRQGVNTDECDSAVSVARLVTVLLRADPALACRLLHRAGSVEDASLAADWQGMLGNKGHLAVWPLSMADADADRGTGDAFDEDAAWSADGDGDDAGDDDGSRAAGGDRYGGLPGAGHARRSGASAAGEELFRVELAVPAGERLGPQAGIWWLRELVRTLTRYATRKARAEANERSRQREAERAAQAERSSGADRSTFGAAADRAAAAAAAAASSGMRSDERDDSAAVDGTGFLGYQRLPEDASRCLSAAVAVMAALACGPPCADGITCAAHVAALLTNTSAAETAGDQLTLAWTLGAGPGAGAMAGNALDGGDLVSLEAVLGRICAPEAFHRAALSVATRGSGTTSQDIAGHLRDEFVKAVSTSSGERLVMCDLALLQALLCDQQGFEAVEHVAGLAASTSSSSSRGAHGWGHQSAAAARTASDAGHPLRRFAVGMLTLVRMPVTAAVKAAALKTLGVAARQPFAAEQAWIALEQACLLPARVAKQAGLPGIHAELEREASSSQMPVTAALASALHSLFAHPRAAVVTASLGRFGPRSREAAATGATPYVQCLAEDVLPALVGPEGPSTAAWPAVCHVLAVIDAVLRGYDVEFPAQGVDTEAITAALADVRRLSADDQSLLRDALAEQLDAKAAPGQATGPAAALAELPTAARRAGQALERVVSATCAADPRLDFCPALDEAWELARPGVPRPHSPGFELLKTIITGGSLRGLLADLLRCCGGPKGAERAGALALGWARTPSEQGHLQARNRVRALRADAIRSQSERVHEEEHRLQQKRERARAAAAAAQDAAAAPAPAPAPANPFATAVLAQAPAKAPAASQLLADKAREAELAVLAEQKARAAAGGRPAWQPGCAGRGCGPSEAAVWTAVSQMAEATAKAESARAAARRGADARSMQGAGSDDVVTSSWDASAAAVVWGIDPGSGRLGQPTALEKRVRRAEGESRNVARAFVVAAEVGDPLGVPSSAAVGTSRLGAPGTSVPVSVWRDRSTMLVCSILDRASRIGPGFIEASRAVGQPLEGCSVAEGLVRERAVGPIVDLVGFSASRDAHVALCASRLLVRVITPDADAAPAGLVLRQVASELGVSAGARIARLVVEEQAGDEHHAIVTLQTRLARTDVLGPSPWPPLSFPDAPKPAGLDETAVGVLGAGLGLGLRPLLAGKPLARGGLFDAPCARWPTEGGLVDSHVPKVEREAAARLTSRTLIFALLRESERCARGQESLAPLLFGLVDASGAPAEPRLPSLSAVHPLPQSQGGPSGGGGGPGGRAPQDSGAASIVFASVLSAAREATAPRRGGGALFGAVVSALVAGSLRGAEEGIHRQCPRIAASLFAIVRNLCSAPGAGARARSFVAKHTAALLTRGAGRDSVDPTVAPGFFALQLRAFFAAMECAASDAADADADPALSLAFYEEAQELTSDAYRPLPSDHNLRDRVIASELAAAARARQTEYDEARIRKHVRLEALATLRTAVGAAAEGLALDLAAMCRQRHAPLRELTLAVASLLEAAPATTGSAARRADGAGGAQESADALRGVAGDAAVGAAAAAAAGMRAASQGSLAGVDGGAGQGSSVARRPLLEALVLAAPMREDREAVALPALLRSVIVAYERASGEVGQVATHRRIGSSAVALYDEAVVAQLARALAHRQLRARTKRILAGADARGHGARQSSWAGGRTARAHRAKAFTTLEGADEADAWDELAASVVQDASKTNEDGIAVDPAAFEAALVRSAGAVVDQAVELARARNHAVEMLASGTALLRGWRRLVASLLLVPRGRLAFGAILSRVPLETAFAGPDSHGGLAVAGGTVGAGLHGSARGPFQGSEASAAHGSVRDLDAGAFAGWIDDEGAATHAVGPASAAILCALLDRAVASLPSAAPIIDEVALACLPLTAALRAGRNPAHIADRAESIVRGLASLATVWAPAGLTPRGASPATRGVIFACLTHMCAACGFGLAPGHPSVPGLALANAGLMPICFRPEGQVATTPVGTHGLDAEAIEALPADVHRRIREAGGWHAPGAASIVAAARGRLRRRDGEPLDPHEPVTGTLPSSLRGSLGRGRGAGDLRAVPGGASYTPLLDGARVGGAAGGAGAGGATARSARDGATLQAAAAAAERARHVNAAAHAACGRALDEAGVALIDRLADDALGGPCTRGASDGGLRLPLSDTRVAATMLLGSLLAAPGMRQRFDYLAAKGAIGKAAAAAIQADSIEDAAMRALGWRPADGRVPTPEDGDGADPFGPSMRGDGRRQDDGLSPKRMRGAGHSAAATSGKGAAAGESETSLPAFNESVLDRVFGGSTGAKRSTLGSVQGMVASATDTTAADKAVAGLSVAGLEDARKQAQASAESALWLLTRLAATPTGAKAVVAAGAISALSGMRWLRWARVEAREFVAGRLGADLQRTISGRHRGRFSAVLRLVLTVASLLPGDAAAVDEIVGFLRVHADVVRVPLRQAASMPDQHSVAMSAIVLRLLALLRPAQNPEVREFLRMSSMASSEIAGLRSLLHRL
ncbi:hypothetical protein FNF27_03506 [Cafeteria roenbergensis]|uniref:Uncharacterized protein n=1 Tax=Cafeteria roenbergensis TaxID=33653 RepID=A0A5A8ECR3_CAFRO|nr:hypothetical protein FNF27_03506 [Cafeteria roenbergensis]